MAKFGPNIEIKARNFDRIIKWGKRKHGESENHEETIHESESN